MTIKIKRSYVRFVRPVNEGRWVRAVRAVKEVRSVPQDRKVLRVQWGLQALKVPSVQRDRLVHEAP